MTSLNPPRFRRRKIKATESRKVIIVGCQIIFEGRNVSRGRRLAMVCSKMPARVMKREVIQHYLNTECKGRLRPAQEQYRERYKHEKESPPSEISR